MGRRRRSPTSSGAGRRVLALLLACLFATGFLPSVGPGCGCTAERNCGCTCWLGSRGPAPAEVTDETQPSCCARAPDADAVAASPCAIGTTSRGGGEGETSDAPSSPGHWRLEWEPTAPPLEPAPEAARASLPVGSLARDSLALEPPTPPPRV